MQKKQVAVLDVGSSKIVAVVGERGINKTFIVKARKDFEYDGFADGEFFDTEALRKTLFACVGFLKNSAPKITSVYVGVPGEFTEVAVKDSQISFPKKRKITEEDVDALFDAAFVMTSQKTTLINRSAIVYELDDYRRLANPVGETSEILKGKLSFVLCSNYFIEAVRNPLVGAGIADVEFTSSVLAEIMYLLDAETRDRIAVLLDVGYISTSFALVQGDGILYQGSFNYGGGYISAAISERFELDFSLAEELKRKINLCRVKSGAIDLISLDNGEYYKSDDVKNVVVKSLDALCESVESCVENCGYNIPEYVPITVTGGGISFIRGAKEHLSGRLGSSVEVAAPKIPIAVKPTESSVYSLLNMTLD